MSNFLRLPFVLLAVLALFLLSPGPAAADTPPPPPPEECAQSAEIGGCETPAVGEVLDDVDLPEPADEGAPPADDTGTPEQSEGVLGDVAEHVAADQPTTEAGDGTEGDPQEGTGTGDEEAADPEPADIPTCVAAALDDLVTGLQDLGPAIEDPTSVLDTLPSLDPADVEAIRDLLAGIGISEQNLADGQRLFQDAIAAIQACLPEPPTSGPPPTTEPPVQRPVQQVSQPAAVYYANCDDARAHGASNIPRGTPGYRTELDRDNDGYACDEETQNAVAGNQPTGKLAYTGAEVDGLIRLGAILVSGGTLILLAGLRRT